jgi:hypothetical protein
MEDFEDVDSMMEREISVENEKGAKHAREECPIRHGTNSPAPVRPSPKIHPHSTLLDVILLFFFF